MRVSKAIRMIDEVEDKDRKAWSKIPAVCPSCGVRGNMTCLPAPIGSSEPHRYGCNDCGWIGLEGHKTHTTHTGYLAMKNEMEEIRDAYRGASGDLINALEQAQKDYGHGWTREVEKIMEAMEMANAGTLENID